MMVWMEEVIVIHILHNLQENDSLNDFADDAKYCYRPIVFNYQGERGNDACWMESLTI